MHPTGPCPEQDPPRDRHHQATLYASLELSRSTWLVTSLAPGDRKMSKHSVAAGDGAALLALLARLRGRVERSAGGPVGVVVVHEAGRDGFWLHRLLEALPTSVGYGVVNIDNGYGAGHLAAQIARWAPAPAQQ